MQILLWGTYDLTKPRVRLMRQALQSCGDLSEIHTNVWTGVEDKSQLRGWRVAWAALRWLTAYPLLILRFMLTPKPDVVVVGYMGQVDMLILAPLARLRRVPIIWDAFLSLYDTVVHDRKLLGLRHPLARLIFALERRACNAADAVVLDTSSHAQSFGELYDLDDAKLFAVFVGVEQDVFAKTAPAALPERADSHIRILFYGQFIPLHGIQTIVEAARLTRDRPFRWHLIGQGQDAAEVRAMLEDDSFPNLEWEPWVPYAQLIDRISECDVCLGVFGISDKASRVIPNKVFQTLMSDKPLITRDSPAMRELFLDEDSAVALVQPGDPQALVAAIEGFAAASPVPDRQALRQRFDATALTDGWMAIVSAVAGRKVT